MKKYIKITPILFIGLLFFSCKNKDSIQKYLVDNQNKNEFLTFDIPINMLQLKEGVSKETEEIIKSIKKINITRCAF